MSIVIARFRRGAVARNATLLAAIGICLFIFAFYNPRNRSMDDIFSQDIFVQPIAIFGLLFGVILPIALSFLLLFRVILENGKALWIRDGTLVYLHKYYLSAKCSEIVEASIGTYGRNHIACVILTMNDEKTKMIPTGSLVERPDAILGCLREMIFATKS